MANTYEKNLTQKSSLTTSDYIRVVGSDNVSYKQLVSDVAKKVIETYAGSSLAGSSQSVKSAIDSLNSNTNGSFHGTLATGTDLNDILGPGVYLLSGGNTYTNCPSTYGVLEAIRISENYTAVMMQRITISSKIYFRYRSSGSWMAWKVIDGSDA